MQKYTDLCRKPYYYLCYFIIYSFLGWVIETIYVSITEYKIVNRGFLYGPFCTVYGFGVLLVITLLQPLRKNIIITFIASVILTSLLEYTTGYVLESAFNNRWWDYSNELLNLHGRICLKISVTWGLASIALLTVVHPLVQKLAGIIPGKMRIIVIYFVLFYLTIDFAASMISLTGPHILIPSPHLFPTIIVFS